MRVRVKVRVRVWVRVRFRRSMPFTPGKGLGFGLGWRYLSFTWLSRWPSAMVRGEGAAAGRGHGLTQIALYSLHI